MADFRTLRDRILEALGDYDFSLRNESDKTAELAKTCAKLASQKAELEDKIKELTDTIAKLKVKHAECCPEEEPKKQVLHG